MAKNKVVNLKLKRFFNSAFNSFKSEKIKGTKKCEKILTAQF